MKHTIFVLISTLLLFSCSKKVAWDEDYKEGFVKGCMNSVDNMIAQSGTNPLEQMNITVDEMCSCQLNKTMAEYPNGPSDKETMLKSTIENTKACMLELKSN